MRLSIANGESSQGQLLRGRLWTSFSAVTYLDQAVSSLSNFVVSLIAARLLSLDEFGLFSLVIGGLALLLGLLRASITEPLVIRNRASSAWPDHVIRAAAGAALLVSLIISIGAGLTLMASGYGAVGLAVAVSAPAVAHQEVLRQALLAWNRSSQALVADGIWLVVTVAVLTGFAIADLNPGIAALLLAWGGGAFASAVFAVTVTSIFPRLQQAFEFFRAHIRESVPVSTEFIAVSGASQVALFSVAAAAGLGVLGELRLGLLALSPVNVLSTAAGITVLRRLARSGGEFSAGDRRYLRLTIFGLFATIACYTLVLLFLPAWLGEWLLGPSWRSLVSVLLPVSAWTLALVAVALGSVALRSLGEQRTAMRLRLLGVVPIILAVVGGAAAWGAHGAAVAGAVANAVMAAVIWRELLRL